MCSSYLLCLVEHWHFMNYQRWVLGFIWGRESGNSRIKTCRNRTSPVVQWVRIHLPVQGTWIQSLVQEDFTCRRATKLPKPVRLEPVLHKRSHHSEKPCAATRQRPPLSTTGESLHTATKIQHNQKIK